VFVVPTRIERWNNTNPIKNGGALRGSGRVSNSRSTSDTRYVNIVTHPVIINDWGNDLEGLTKPFGFVLLVIVASVLFRYTDSEFY
jgi:hypothetical protein